MKKSVIDTIKKHIENDFVLEKPKDNSFGHYATPLAFSLAKSLRKSPMIIADELCLKFADEVIFESATAIKGYINFKLSDDFLNIKATDAIEANLDFAKGQKEQTILLEFVSANPTGPMHIGHARGAVFGDTLANIGKHLGYQITTEYYVNDAGSQIEMLGLSILLAGQDRYTEIDVKWPDEFYRGEYVYDLADDAKEAFGIEIFSDENSIPKLSTWGKDKMMDLIRANLAMADIAFDSFVSEKTLFEKWDASYEKLKSEDGVYEKEGKVWLKSSEKSDEKDRVVVREDGRPTYLAGDIIYHDDKFQRRYDHYINIWGADHHGYIARVKAAISYLGYESDKLEVILSQMVALLKGGEPYKMSKRAGNFILMSDVIDEIGSDALRFVFLTKKSDTHLEFDVDLLKQQDSSNPIYYINYAHARINQIFQKSGKSVEDVVGVHFNNLDEDSRNLLFSALLLHEVLEDAFESRQLQKLTEYLRNLAASYHQFYNKHKIVGSVDEDQLLKLSAMVATSIRVGLSLMGITAKSKM
ncbi:MAG: arginine--tRNA ligase [Epsilonproteobacteria bacterium]|nr:arginine--tRNA ligase [Campylobacterota bacterium]